MEKKYVLLLIIFFIAKNGPLDASFGGGDGVVLTD
jgi:hypothetical protein